MKNKLTDLNDHLFAELERLGDEDLDEEKMKTEIDRAKALGNIANSIINNAKLSLDAVRLQVEYGGTNRSAIELPPMLENNSNGKKQG